MEEDTMNHIEKTMVFSNSWMVVLFNNSWIDSNMEQFNSKKFFLNFYENYYFKHQMKFLNLMQQSYKFYNFKWNETLISSCF